MEKYIVTFRYNKKIDLPEDEEEAAVRTPGTLLPLLENGIFEFYSIRRLYPSRRSEQFDYDPTLQQTFTIVEVKIVLSAIEANSPEGLLRKVTDELAAQRLLLERVDEELLSDPMFADADLSTEEKIELAEDEKINDDTATSQTIITFSHCDRNRIYPLDSYSDQLKAG